VAGGRLVAAHRGEADLAGGEIIAAAARMVRTAAGAADTRLLARLGVRDARHCLAVTRVRARVGVLAPQPGVPALLEGLQPIQEELRAGPAEGALTEVRRRGGAELGRVEGAVVERHRLAGGRLSHAGETGGDVAAVADRVAAGRALQPRACSDRAPPDGEQRVVVRRPAGVIDAAA